MGLTMDWGSGVGVRECQIQPLTLTTMATTVGTRMEKDPNSLETSSSLYFTCFNLHNCRERY